MIKLQDIRRVFSSPAMPLLGGNGGQEPVYHRGKVSETWMAALRETVKEHQGATDDVRDSDLLRLRGALREAGFTKHYDQTVVMFAAASQDPTLRPLREAFCRHMDPQNRIDHFESCLNSECSRLKQAEIEGLIAAERKLLHYP